MTFSNNNKNFIKFYVNDHIKAISWYRDHIGKHPIHQDDEKAIFDTEDAFIVLIKRPNAHPISESIQS